MFRVHTEHRLIPLGYIILWGAMLYAIPCDGQVIAGSLLVHDSLYHPVVVEGPAILSCRFSYLQGSAVIHSSPDHNAVELHKLDVFIRSAFSRPEQFVERIRLTGYSSIDGNYSTNEQLSRERVESFRLYLLKHYPELSQYPCDLAWVGEDWGEFARLVKLSAIDEKAEILEIIRKVPHFDTREELLVKLNGGRAYHELDSTILPLLCRVEIKVGYSGRKLGRGTLPPEPQPSPREREQEDSLVVNSVASFDTKAIDKWLGIGSAKRRKNSFTPALSNFNNPHGSFPLSFGEGRGEAVGSRALLAIKTNALLWASVQSDFKHTAPVANIALEYYINRNWSVEAGAMYSYWNYNNNVEFQGLSGYYLEPRFRVPLFSNKLEVFTGVYGRVGDYDQRRVDSSQLIVDSYHAGGNASQSTSSYTGEYWDTGVSAGLSVHLFGGFGLELGARAGYVKTKAAMYTYEKGENWFDEYKPYGKVKVTDLNLSLVYRLK